MDEETYLPEKSSHPALEWQEATVPIAQSAVEPEIPWSFTYLYSGLLYSHSSCVRIRPPPIQRRQRPGAGPVKAARLPCLAHAREAVSAKEVSQALLPVLAMVAQGAAEPGAEREDEALLISSGADRRREQVPDGFHQQGLRAPAVLLDRIGQAERHLHQPVVEERDTHLERMRHAHRIRIPQQRVSHVSFHL